MSGSLNSIAEMARRVCELQGIDYDAALSADPRWWREPDDYELDGVLRDGRTGRAKEVVYENGVAFPILTAKQARDNALTPEKREENVIENRHRCFSDSMSDYEDATFANLAPDTDEYAFRACSSYVSTFDDKRKAGMGLILLGEPGVGKTHLAACTCNALVDAGHRCRMTSVRWLVNVGESKFGSWAELLRNLRRYGLVVLDDLGTERNSDYMDERVFDVIDHLYAHHVPIIVTTNIPFDRVMRPNGRAATRIFDRLKERCQIVEVTGRNRRQMHA